MMPNIYIVAPLLFAGAFLTTFIIIPKISWIVKSLELNDKPGARSSHKKSTPTMAGFSFFIALVIVVFFLKHYDLDNIALNFIAGITIVFIVGFKDDLVLSSPRAKLLGQFIAISFLFIDGMFQTINLNGFLEINALNPYASFICLYILMLGIINSFNLIDGVDGLSSTIGVIIFIVYAFIFFATGLFFYGLLCVSLIGILKAYLVFNFSESKKIFMGDTGSLLIGFCISFFTLKCMSMDASRFSQIDILPNFMAYNKLLLVLVIMFIPFFDTSRVAGIRILQKRSPFYPDRNHVHHVLMDAGCSHKKTTVILGSLSLIITFVFLALGSLHYLLLMGIMFVIYCLLLLFVDLIRRKKTSLNNHALTSS